MASDKTQRYLAMVKGKGLLNRTEVDTLVMDAHGDDSAIVRAKQLQRIPGFRESWLNLEGLRSPFFSLRKMIVISKV